MEDVSEAPKSEIERIKNENHKEAVELCSPFLKCPKCEFLFLVCMIPCILLENPPKKFVP
jgi:hypothetical protein